MKSFYQMMTIGLVLILALTLTAFAVIGMPNLSMAQPVRAFSQSEIPLPPLSVAQPTDSPALVLAVEPTPPPTAQPTAQPRPDAPLIAAGRELVDRFACATCHGANLSGSSVPMRSGFGGGSTPRNLTPDIETGLGTWTEADLIRVFREGTRPDGRRLSSMMPWQAFGSQMSDDDITALYAYLQSIPALPYNTR